MFGMLPAHSSSVLPAILPPRPVSVGSSMRISAVSPAAYQKNSRSSSVAATIHDDETESSLSFVVASASSKCPPCLGREMEDVLVNGLQELRYRPRPELQFDNLPIEIHEAILDHLFGERASMSTLKSSNGSWNTALRHPRRKALSNLSLISRVWRPLVQERIYRHIKIKGTMDGLAECATWFLEHPHLASYVRHVEIWIPVWGNRVAKKPPHHRPVVRSIHENNSLTDMTVLSHVATMTWDDPDVHTGSNYRFHYSSCNATLEDIFQHVKAFYPEARVLTLEGGHCKKPPMVQHFRDDSFGGIGPKHLQVLPNIQTLVMRGAWNIMRDYQHWSTLSEALPALREWHCAYAKPKVEAYQIVSHILWTLSPSLVHLNLSLGGFYNKEGAALDAFSEKAEKRHLCLLLGRVAPRLESLTFTGTVCACLFQRTRASVVRLSTTSKLKSVDLIVQSCCREKPADQTLAILEDTSGIANPNFIRSFEGLIVAAVLSLEYLRSLNSVRIRFVDLDSVCPLLNPYFQLVNNRCTGLWSEHILDALHAVRPAAQFFELSAGIYPQYGHDRQIVGAVYPHTRPRSIHASSYRFLSDASKH